METYPLLTCIHEAPNYRLYYKLNWDAYLEYSSASRTWEFDPGNGEPRIPLNMSTAMFFIQPTFDDIARALDSWQWLPIAGKEPILVTAFGDIFLSDDVGVWFLDTVEGNLSKVCDSREELGSLLQNEEAADHFLLAGFVERASREGMLLSPDQCYDFKINPVVGGEISFENVSVQNFVVAVNLAGQLHDQARHLPEGTRITGFSLKPEE